MQHGVDEATTFHSACVINAERHLRAATSILENEELPHIAYHLATLALEELGKATLYFGAKALNSTLAIDRAERKFDDHITKLTLGLWNPFIPGRPIDPKDFDDARLLAKTIHGKRLEGLYVALPKDLDRAELPGSSIQQSDAAALISVVRERLNREKGRKNSEATMDAKDFSWFRDAVADPELSRYVFSSKSITKLAAFDNDPWQWLPWLREEVKSLDEECADLLKRETSRDRSSRKQSKERWRVRLRIASNTHSVRPKIFGAWNKVNSSITFHAIQDRKDQFFADLVFTDAVPITALWNTSFLRARELIVALNVGTVGLFWWHFPPHSTRFYEEIIDLENDKRFQLDLSVASATDLKLHRGALCEADLARASQFLKKLRSFPPKDRMTILVWYYEALVSLGKSDIHGALLPTAAAYFATAFLKAMRLTGVWNGDKGLQTSSAREALAGLVDAENIQSLLDIFSKLDECETEPRVLKTVTPEWVSRAKIMCDLYLNKISADFDVAKTDAA